jgi:molecular chaperone DnaK
MKLGEALYKAQGAAGGASTDGEVPNVEKDEDDIVDADFTEVGDDDKKTS